MTEVQVQDLVKSFQEPKTGKETRVLKGMSFTVNEGDFVAILGPSGCGKSTLLRLIAGLEGATGGKLIIGGKDVTAVPAAKRELAMVFQNYALFPHLSVRDNIEFGLKARKVDAATRATRTAEAAKLMELEQLLDRKPAALSGGQRQRVALARALVSGHKLVLMDEPLSNLDARLRAEMRRSLRNLQQRLDLTVLYVTHDQVEAMTMADKVLLLREGYVEQYAAPPTLYNWPASIRVGRFVGSPPMNLLNLSGDEYRGLETTSAQVNKDNFPAGNGGEITMGIRPEDLRFTGRDGDVQVGTALVDHAELLGSDRLYFLTAGNAERSALTIRTTPRVQVSVGDTVTLFTAAEDIRWFDHESGLTLDSDRQAKAEAAGAGSIPAGAVGNLKEASDAHA